MKKLITSRKGEGYIDVAIGIVALMMVIVVTLNIYSFFTLKQDMDEICGQLIETATFTGSFGDEFDERCEELQNTFFAFDVATSATEYYNEAYERVQLGDTMTLTISVHTNVQGIGAFKIPITVQSTRSGISEKYWK